MRFDIMTLFPDLVTHVLGESIIGRAQKSGACEIYAHNIRDYSEDKHRRVDDTPYGGGMGMVMTCQPIYDCYRSIVDNIPEDERRRVIRRRCQCGVEYYADRVFREHVRSWRSRLFRRR